MVPVTRVSVEGSPPVLLAIEQAKAAQESRIATRPVENSVIEEKRRVMTFITNECASTLEEGGKVADKPDENTEPCASLEKKEIAKWTVANSTANLALREADICEAAKGSKEEEKLDDFVFQQAREVLQQKQLIEVIKQIED